MSLCVHDRFDNEPGTLVDLVSNLKSPAGLLDVFVNAVIRSMKPLSYKEFTSKYHDTL